MIANGKREINRGFIEGILTVRLINQLICAHQAFKKVYGYAFQ